MGEENDLQIELGQSVRRHIERKASLLRDTALVAAPYGSPESEQTPVFIAEHVMRAIERHAAEQKDREIGGVLLGGFYRCDDGSFIEVTDMVEAKAAKGTDVSLTFTHDTWEQIHAEQARRAPDLQIVGWYHSHPALGVFMSKEDEFIHTSYFADPWHVAVVVDPIYHNWGCFKWVDGALERTDGFFIFAQKKAAKRVRDYTKNLVNTRQAAPRSASASADRGNQKVKTAPLWAAVAVLLVLQVVTMMVALSRGGRMTDDYMAIATNGLQHSDLHGALDALRAELARNPANMEAHQKLRVLCLVLSDPSIREFDNDKLDAMNAMVAGADGLARMPAKSKSTSLWEQLSGLFQEKPEILESTAVPVEEAVKAFEVARPTREERLRRAELINRLLESTPGAKGLRADYGKAAEWLSKEHLREIAFSRRAGTAGNDKAYKGLSAKDRKWIQDLGSTK